MTGAASAGLAALRPVADGNVVYSFHFYEPAELTSLAAYRPGLDRAALARLPFPADAGGLRGAGSAGRMPTTGGLIRFYCALRWDAAQVGAADRDRRRTWGRRNHAAVLLGEFGASAALAPVARAGLAARGAAGVRGRTASAGRCGAMTTSWGSLCRGLPGATRCWIRGCCGRLGWRPRIKRKAG